ncbi:MAG: hypothetical protein IJ769_06550, partial [Clostridia bacterium]|nr:hypothetical protein [Clostridia bacterium]
LGPNGSSIFGEASLTGENCSQVELTSYYNILSDFFIYSVEILCKIDGANRVTSFTIEGRETPHQSRYACQLPLKGKPFGKSRGSKKPSP